MRPVVGTLLLVLVSGMVGCGPSQVHGDRAAAPPGRAAEEPAAPDPARVEAAGLHNVYRITDRLYSGSSPDGDEGFRSLQQLGIKTILSVDGARPDVALAHKYGMRYVHLPIGYDGMPRDQALRIA